VAEGFFGAAILPLSQMFLQDMNPREKAGSAMAMSGAGIIAGPIFGPTLGGWLTESCNQRWVFLINLPVGIIAMIGCAAYLPKCIRCIRRFDCFRFGIVATGVFTLFWLSDDHDGSGAGAA